MYSFHKLTAIEPCEGFSLIGTFETGKKKLYHMDRLAKQFPVFEVLRDNPLFGKARVDTGGYGVIWNDDLDLSSEDIWEFGRDIV